MRADRQRLLGLMVVSAVLIIKIAILVAVFG